MNDDSTSTEKTWELLSDKLRSFLLQRVSDEQVAEDLLQETFVRIHRKLDEIDDAQRITSWVFQIARNLIVDHYRSKARAPKQLAGPLLEKANDWESNVDGENLNELVAGWLPQMISQLPDKYREPVELYELEGVPQKKIADELGLSLSGAKSRVQRGREQLKTMLFDCCSFEQDHRGNVIGFARNAPKCGCDDDCGTSSIPGEDEN